MSPERLRPDDIPNLVFLRQEVADILGKPSPDTVSHYLNQLSLFSEESIYKPLDQPQNSTRFLRRIREEVLQIFPDRPYSRPFICAYGVANLGYQVLSHAIKVANNSKVDNSLEIFAALFDMVSGMSFVPSNVTKAEDELRGTSAKTLSRFLDIYSEILTPVEQAEAQLSSIRSFLYFANLLKQDPSGFLIAEDSLKIAKDPAYAATYNLELSIPYSLIPQFVVFGVESGEKLYKRLYPLTSQTTPPKSF